MIFQVLVIFVPIFILLCILMIPHLRILVEVSHTDVQEHSVKMNSGVVVGGRAEIQCQDIINFR